MQRRGEIPSGAKFTLFMLFFLGFALNILIFLDLQFWHYVFKPPAVSPETIEALKQGILNVRVASCDGQGINTGTGFVVRSGYVATVAHVVKDRQVCRSDISVVDFKGIESPAELVGFSESDDLALLKIRDLALPALPLADSTAYETVHGVVPVVTIGYPLEGIASQRDRAAISGQGSLSDFDNTKNRFVTSGLNINAGNSGGPVFLRDQWKVLGLAVARLDVTVGEEIGWAIPSKTLKKFFRERTGQELE